MKSQNQEKKIKTFFFKGAQEPAGTKLWGEGGSRPAGAREWGGGGIQRRQNLRSPDRLGLASQGSGDTGM